MSEGGRTGWDHQSNLKSFCYKKAGKSTGISGNGHENDTSNLIVTKTTHIMIVTIAQSTNKRVLWVYKYRELCHPVDEGCWRNLKRTMCNYIVES